jgi:restriction endonuclease-like protein
MLSYAAKLRRELSERSLKFALKYSLLHTQSYGPAPAIVFSPDSGGVKHGNFVAASFRAIAADPAWLRRYGKRHTQFRSLPSCDHGTWKELDSCNSSDALLMNIFCYPGTLKSPAVRRLLAVGDRPVCLFGYKARVPLINDRMDRTEVDLLLSQAGASNGDALQHDTHNDLLIEAKLTESGFQTRDQAVMERYRDFREVFDPALLRKKDGNYLSYQLIRNALAAHATGKRFCVMLDARRPDLIEAWHGVQRAMKLVDLRTRCLLLTWQEMAAVLPPTLQRFLAEKYGIAKQHAFSLDFDPR